MSAPQSMSTPTLSSFISPVLLLASGLGDEHPHLQPKLNQMLSFLDLGQTDLAEDLLLRSEFAKKEGAPLIHSLIFEVVTSMIHLSRGQFAVSRSHFLSLDLAGYHLLDTDQLAQLEAFKEIQLALCAFELRDAESCENHSLAAFTHAQKCLDAWTTYTSQLTLALALADQGHKEASESCLQDAWKGLSDFKILEARHFLLAGQVYIRLDKQHQAQDVIERGLEQAKGFSILQAQMHLALMESHARSGHLELTQEHHQKAQALLRQVGAESRLAPLASPSGAITNPGAAGNSSVNNPANSSKEAPPAEQEALSKRPILRVIKP